MAQEPKKTADTAHRKLSERVDAIVELLEANGMTIPAKLKK